MLSFSALENSRFHRSFYQNDKSPSLLVQSPNSRNTQTVYGSISCQVTFFRLIYHTVREVNMAAAFYKWASVWLVADSILYLLLPL